MSNIAIRYLHFHIIEILEGVLLMARGKEFNHKRKGHPGKFPEDTLVERKSKDAIGDEEFIVVQEAFKNRVEEQDVE
jgi:hypothetical protein